MTDHRRLEDSMIAINCIASEMLDRACFPSFYNHLRPLGPESVTVVQFYARKMLPSGPMGVFSRNSEGEAVEFAHVAGGTKLI